jgi:hypothetical protein
MKKRTLAIVAALMFGAMTMTSCSQNKDLKLNGKTHTFESYGWANYNEVKNDSVLYEASVGNIVWSVILSETVIVPIWLTGWDLYSPVRVKCEYAQ